MCNQCDGIDCQCGDPIVIRMTPYALRRMTWRNLSPVVERIKFDGGAIARHADGRYTLESTDLMSPRR